MWGKRHNGGLVPRLTRLSDGDENRLPAIASDFVRRRTAIIVASRTPSAMAAKAATSTIPIVFSTGIDPVAQGLVASMNRPDGNATGVAVFSNELGPKRLGLLRELVPKADLIAFVVNPDSAISPLQIKAVQAPAQALGQKILVVNASRPDEIDHQRVANPGPPRQHQPRDRCGLRNVCARAA
jgi:ABC-type uncharacterized transport system substrate-binding protein